MFDRTLVVSGFDTETLVSEKYLAYLLLAQVEAGVLNLLHGDVQIHPPPPANYLTSYRDGPADDLLPPTSSSTFEIELLPGDPSAVLGVAFASDDNSVLIHSADGWVRQWRYEDHSEVQDSAFEVPDAFASAFDGEADQFAMSAPDHSILVWKVATRTVVQTLAGHTLAPIAVAFAGNGRRVASASLDKTVRVWNTVSGEPVAVFEGHGATVNAVKLVDDGTIAVSGDDAGIVHLWNVDTCEIIKTFQEVSPGNARIVVSTAISSNGDRVAWGKRNGEIKVWDVQGNQPPLTLIGHSGSVTALDFSQLGRLASAGEDGTVRTWDASGAERMKNQRHRAPVRALCNSHGASRIVGGDEAGIAWVLDRDRDENSVEVRPNFCKARFKVSRGSSPEFTVELFANVDLTFEPGANGLERGHALRISFARFTDQTRAFLEQPTIGEDVATLEQQLRSEVDRKVPLNIAGGQSVQQIRMRKFFDRENDKRSLGLYVDLALRAGPEPDNFLPPRGDVTKSVDFRGSDDFIAFATSPHLFPLLGKDFKFKLAEETAPGSGDYRYPLRHDLFDKSSDPYGSINSVSAGPQKLPSGEPTGKLYIAIDAEISIPDFPNPDVTVTLTLDPTVQPDKSVEWPFNVDVDAGIWALIVSAIVGAITFVISGGAGAVVGSMLVAFLAQKLIAEPVFARIIEDNIDEDNVASLFDALPFDLPAARRRWDPFYETLHTVQALVDEKPVIDDDGLAFTAPAVRLSRKPRMLTDLPIRDELRDGMDLTGVFYRLENYDDHRADLEANAPGTDRQSFAGPAVTGVPDMVALTIDEVVARKPKGLVLAPQTLHAKGIYVPEGTIEQLLCVTERETAEASARLIDQFRDSRHAQIAADEHDQFTAEALANLPGELGRQPTQDEVDKRVSEEVDAYFNETIAPLQADFEKNVLPGALEAELAKILRFDLPPGEMYVLQKAGILMIDGKEIVKRKNSAGDETFYFRDKPDGNPDDNLLSLPHYSPPYVPPV